MKLLARDDRARPHDADDLRALLRLITERGFARRRDLSAALAAAIDESG